jgi:hypothetical protein
MLASSSSMFLTNGPAQAPNDLMGGNVHLFQVLQSRPHWRRSKGGNSCNSGDIVLRRC